MDPTFFNVTPALQRPPNVAYDFENSENILPLIKLAPGLCLGASSLLVIYRIWTQSFIIKARG